MKNHKHFIDFDATPAQIAIVQKLGSKNREESFAAAEAIAAITAKPLLQVIDQEPVISNLFSTLTYDEGTPATIDLDPYFDVKTRNFLQVWSQTVGGGLATNFVQGISEMFVNCYDLFSAISMKKKQLRAGRIDHLAAHMSRLAQEVLKKQEVNAANVLMAAMAGARLDGDSANTANTNLQFIDSTTAGVLQLDDFNKLMTAYARAVSSWVGGTPAGQKRKLSDLLLSPEKIGDVRAIAYQPMNTRAGSLTTSGATSLAAPEALREEIYRNAGNASIYGVELHEVQEMGVGQEYNTLFKSYIGTTAIGASNAAFNAATQELVIGLNTAMFDLVRLREVGSQGSFSLSVDDQFSVRSDTVGYFGGVREGYVSLENRGKYGLIIR